MIDNTITARPGNPDKPEQVSTRLAWREGGAQRSGAKRSGAQRSRAQRSGAIRQGPEVTGQKSRVRGQGQEVRRSEVSG